MPPRRKKPLERGGKKLGHTGRLRLGVKGREKPLWYWEEERERKEEIGTREEGERIKREREGEEEK